MSFDGVRRCRYCGVVATNSLVPMHAAICAKRHVEVEAPIEPRRGSPDAANRCRCSADTRARRSTSTARRSQLSSGGSHGVPIDRSTTPPSSAAASGAKPIEPIVRIGRGNEAGGFSHGGTILPDRDRLVTSGGSGGGDDELGQPAGRRIREPCSHSHTVLVVMGRHAPRPRDAPLPGGRRGRTGSATRRSC